MSIKFLTKEELEKLTTKRLLAYKNKLMKCPEGYDWEPDSSYRITKQDPKWQEIYSLVKDILSKREHVNS